jgi:hypothetical protein
MADSTQAVYTNERVLQPDFSTYQVGAGDNIYFAGMLEQNDRMIGWAGMSITRDDAGQILSTPITNFEMKGFEDAVFLFEKAGKSVYLKNDGTLFTKKK